MHGNIANTTNNIQNELASPHGPQYPMYSIDTGNLMSAASIMLNYEQGMELEMLRMLQKKRKKPNTKQYSGLKFTIACPNIVCVADSSALERLGGTGGTREGFCCSSLKGGCDERWSQRIYKCDEKTAVCGSDDPMVRPCAKLSYRDKLNGVAKRSRREDTVASGIILQSVTFNGFTVQKGDRVDITHFDGPLARVIATNQIEIGVVPVCMIAMNNGQCPRHPNCVKNSGHVGKCRIV